MQIEIIQQTINKLREISRNLENIKCSKMSKIQKDCFKSLLEKITDLNKLCQEIQTKKSENMKLTIINDLERLSHNDIVMKMLRRRDGSLPSDSAELMKDRNVLEIGYTEDLKENLQKLKDYEQFLLNEHGISAEYLNELRQERTELPVIEAIIEMSHNLENS